MIEPFVSVQTLHAIYLERLESLVRDHARHGDIGAFVLGAANAVHDRDLRAQLEPDLRRALDELTASVPSLLDLVPDTADEDLLVFLRIAAVGLANLQTTQFAQRGVWRLQFNQTRGFRPQRSAADPFARLHVPFNPRAFHFNKPYLAKERFWEQADDGGPAVSIFFNKFPFAGHHLLLVPRRRAAAPQFLTAAAHDLMWETVGASTLDGFGAGYNSLGAFGSVNHLHFQVFAEPEGLPVMSPDWTHNGGPLDYPIPCEVFPSAAAAWPWVARQHQRNRPYNIVYTKAGLYCFDRKPQLTYEHAAWTSGFAWYELAGCAIVNTQTDFDALTEDEITRELGRLAPTS